MNMHFSLNFTCQIFTHTRCNLNIKAMAGLSLQRVSKMISPSFPGPISTQKGDVVFIPVTFPYPNCNRSQVHISTFGWPGGGGENSHYTPSPWETNNPLGTRKQLSTFTRTCTVMIKTNSGKKLIVISVQKQGNMYKLSHLCYRQATSRV